MTDSAEAVIKRARSDTSATRFMDAYEAQVRATLGQYGTALELLARHLRDNPAERRTVAASPWFKPLRTHPEFARLTRPPG
jgi:hypothetical protein